MSSFYRHDVYAHPAIATQHEDPLPFTPLVPTVPQQPMQQEELSSVPVITIVDSDDEAAPNHSQQHRPFIRRNSSSVSTSFSPMKGGMLPPAYDQITGAANQPQAPQPLAPQPLYHQTPAASNIHSRVHSVGGLSSSTTTSNDETTTRSESPLLNFHSHCVYGGNVEPIFGNHSILSTCPNDIRFVPANNAQARAKLDGLVKKYILPGNTKPVGAQGIFCGQITHKNPLYALALLADCVKCRIFAVRLKFRPDNSGNGRVKGHVEFYVESGVADQLVQLSKGLVCCEDGGFWVATSRYGTEVLKNHKLDAPPVVLGVPQWPVTMEPLQKNLPPPHYNNQNRGVAALRGTVVAASSYRHQQ